MALGHPNVSGAGLDVRLPISAGRVSQGVLLEETWPSS